MAGFEDYNRPEYITLTTARTYASNAKRDIHQLCSNTGAITANHDGKYSSRLYILDVNDKRRYQRSSWVKFRSAYDC